MIEDKHLKRQFTMEDQVGSLEVGVENMTGRLDLNPNLSGDVSRRDAVLRVASSIYQYLSSL